MQEGDIFYDIGGCQIDVIEYPITDKVFDQVINMNFEDFIRSYVYIPNHPDFDIEIEVNISEFIEKYLDDDKKKIVDDYITDNMIKLTEKFCNRSLKSARNL
jgi:hypothetical protein